MEKKLFIINWHVPSVKLAIKIDILNCLATNFKGKVAGE